MELQPRLFNDLPPTREETPVHQLNYPTFAGAENTVWHGRTAALKPSNHPPFTQRDGWDPQRDEPAHVGTFEAAAHRGLGVHMARRDQRDPGGSANQRGTYRPRDEMMEVAGTERLTQMLPFRIREGSMANTPDMPVSDALANIAAGEDGNEYLDPYFDELMSAGVIDETDYDAADFDFEEAVWEQGHYPAPIEDTGGLYYRNDHEDPGSVSAVVPSAKDLQHWPTEVLAHSTDPGKRRTAEFLRGRGY